MTTAGWHRLARRAALALVLGAGLPAVGVAADERTLVDERLAMQLRDFRLADQDGRTRSLGDFRGKVLLLFFGYVNCPDICPTTLEQMVKLHRALGADAERVQVALVSLDPERDTGPLLKDYLAAFDRSFVGLRGDDLAVAAAARSLRVYYQRIPGAVPGRYVVDHTAATFAFDPQGRLRAMFDPGQTAERMLPTVRALLHES